MRPQQYWEAAQRLCVTLRDLAVDPESLAALRRIDAALRRPADKKLAQRVYEQCSLARDALQHGDTADARQILTAVRGLLYPEEAPAPGPKPPEPGTEKTGAAPEQPAPAREADEPAAQSAAPEKPAAEKPAPEKASPRRQSALRGWALRTFGGEKGRIQAEIGQLENRVAAWELQRAALTRKRDELQAAVRGKVEAARQLDPRSPEYQELRHQAMMIKPEADVYAAQVSRLMANVEKYSGLIAAYHASLLNRETGLSADEVSRMSIRLEDIESANEEAEALQSELDGITGRAQGVLSAPVRTADEGGFFDDLVRQAEAEAPAADPEPVPAADEPPVAPDSPAEADPTPAAMG